MPMRLPKAAPVAAPFCPGDMFSQPAAKLTVMRITNIFDLTGNSLASDRHCKQPPKAYPFCNGLQRHHPHRITIDRE
jgi:hypothetical protein